MTAKYFLNDQEHKYDLITVWTPCCHFIINAASFSLRLTAFDIGSQQILHMGTGFKIFIWITVWRVTLMSWLIGRLATLVQTEQAQQVLNRLLWNVEFCTGISQEMNPSDFGDNWTWDVKIMMHIFFNRFRFFLSLLLKNEKGIELIKLLLYFLFY